MRIIFILLLFFSAGLTSWAQKDDFKISQIFPIEASHSYVGFSIRYMGYAMVRGRFPVFKGAVRFDERDVAKTSVSISIEVASLDTDNDWRDKDLKSDNWFAAETYPRIEFVSQKTEITAQGLNVTGLLTIRGTTKTVMMAMATPSGVLGDVRGDSQVVFTGSLTINRNDYGVEGKNWSAVKEGMTAVASEVNIEITILAKQIKEKNFRNWVSDPESPEGKIYGIVKTEGVENAVKKFESLKADPANKIAEGTLNTAAYMLLKENRSQDALVLFRKNVDAYPQNGMVYSSYAECLASLENWSDAKKYYSLALEKDPGNMSIREVLRHIKP